MQLTGLAVAAMAAVLIAERLWPKRRDTARQPVQGVPHRTIANLALGAVNVGVVAGVQQPLAQRLAAHVAVERQGLAQQLPGPTLLRDAFAFLLLDWSNYHWHVATHRVSMLWRLHRVHHSDTEMDATTALRFHAIDMALGVPLRLLQVRLLGVSPRALAAWEGFFLGSVWFHHADIDLPFDAELSYVLTTPGMHDIHHRADLAALDANFSAGLSVWDRLHRTFSRQAPDVPIGIPGHGSAVAGFGELLLMPFGEPTDLAEPVNDITCM